MPLTEREAKGARSLGVRVIAHAQPDGSTTEAMELGCSLLAGTRCSTYETWLPAKCASYSCVLRDDYLAGERSLDACLDLIATYREEHRRAEQATDESPSGVLDPDAALSTAVVVRMQRKYFKVPPPARPE